MTAFLVALALVCYALTVYLLAGVFERVYTSAIAERDQAREEVKTLRAALFPQLTKLVAGEPKRAQAAATPPGRSPQPPAFSSRIPFRQRFKMLVRAHNTKQLNHDRLAGAIAKSQEASNA